MTRQEILAIAKPILFNTEMAGAILDNRKTVTRRVVKPRYRADEWGFQVITTSNGEFIRVEKIDEDECGIFADGTERIVSQPYNVGDYLYVRETWRMQNYGYSTETHTYEGQKLEYRADFSDIENEMYGRRGGCAPCKWHPSTRMPKEAARLFLRVTDVRVERLQDITEEQTIAEGIEEHIIPESGYKRNGGKKLYERADGGGTTYYPTEAFAELWDSTIKKSDLPLYGWEANPWVWVIEFERVNADG